MSTSAIKTQFAVQLAILGELREQTALLRELGLLTSRTADSERTAKAAKAQKVEIKKARKAVLRDLLSAGRRMRTPGTPPSRIL